jgi:hypothetical protein
MAGMPMLAELPGQQDLHWGHYPNLLEPSLFLQNSQTEDIWQQ